MIKVGILGTSNSLIGGGYSYTLAAFPGIEVVANASLGSSHACMVPYRLNRLNDVDLDYLVIDICVNEQRALYPGMYNLEQTEDVFRYVLLWCSRRGVKPIFLLMPEMLPGPAHLARKVRDAYHRLGGKFGVEIEDGYSLLDQITVTEQRSVESCFADLVHANPEFSREIGRRLGNSILLSSGKKKRRRIFLASEMWFAPTTVGKVKQRGTNLVTEKFSQMGEGDAVTVGVGAGSRVVGLALNMSQTNASLRINGKVKRLDNAYYDPERSMWMVVWGLIDPIESSSGSVKIEVVRSQDGVGELTDHIEGRPIPTYEDQPPLVELAGIIAAGRRKPRLMRL